MHIKPYLGEEIGHGKSGFAVNRGVVNRGFTLPELRNVTHIRTYYVESSSMKREEKNIYEKMRTVFISRKWQ